MLGFTASTAWPPCEARPDHVDQVSPCGSLSRSTPMTLVNVFDSVASVWRSASHLLSEYPEHEIGPSGKPPPICVGLQVWKSSSTNTPAAWVLLRAYSSATRPSLPLSAGKSSPLPGPPVIANPGLMVSGETGSRSALNPLLLMSVRKLASDRPVHRPCSTWFVVSSPNQLRPNSLISDPSLNSLPDAVVYPVPPPPP